MKNSTKLFAIALLITGFSAKSFAQASDYATATAAATIVAPISITKTIDMEFGNIAVGATDGTVVLDPAGSRTPTGGITLPAATGTVSAASFDVEGEGTYTYAITLPASVVLTRQTGTETMTVNAFTSTPSAIGTLLGGAQTLTVGATLNVSTGQVPGNYVSSAPFTVTVNYN
jgi:hypothetical protein